MALLIKNARPTRQTPATVEQWIKVSRATASLPATATTAMFTVTGGRILLKAMIGEVTTVIQTQACNYKVSSAPTVGTAVDLASNLDITGDEVGCLYFVEGDGTALIGANAGAALSGVGSVMAVIPTGSITVTTSATSTGAVKWDLYYMPLDPTATVTAA